MDGNPDGWPGRSYCRGGDVSSAMLLCRLIVTMLLTVVGSTISACSDSRPDGERSVGTGGIDGNQLFAVHCAACHGPDGRGRIGPDLTRKDFTYGKTGKALMETLVKGRPGGMPPFGNRLSSQELRVLVDYVRSL